MKPVYRLEIGDEAPSFRLPSHLDSIVTLEDYRGNGPVVLMFHPLCYTPVCANQVGSLQRVGDRYREAGAEVLILSVDSVPSKKSWAQELGGVDIPMLADFWPHGHVAAQYGVLRGEGISERAIFVVDKDGKIAWMKVYNITELPDDDEVLDAVRALS